MDVLIVGGIFREVIDGDSEPRSRYGGSGLTASVAAARFGADVGLASYVGADDERAVRAELEIAGVHDQSVVTVAGLCGTFVFPSRKGQRRLGPMYRPAEAVPESMPQISESNVIVAFGIPDFDPISEGWLNDISHLSTVIWDRQGWLSRARDGEQVLRLDALKRLYFANEEEAIEDAAVSSIDEAVAIQPVRGFDAAVIKRGPAGVIVVESIVQEVTLTHVPAFVVNAGSTVGSGDVFAGVFAARLALGESTVEAARWGCAAAAICIETGRNLLTAQAYEQARALVLDQHP